ncbi:hypothetical protein IKG02_03675 [Candidatus Saccharibacteria bacterium]|nr:hypothetical protein [Candidatus Saccharibacteria bacterium]
MPAVLSSMPMKKEKVANQKPYFMIGGELPFNPRKEFLSGRYYFDNSVNAGKLNRGFLVRISERSPFSTDPSLDDVKVKLAQFGVCVPSMVTADIWLSRKVGRDWRHKPEQVARAFGLDFFSIKKPLYIATASVILTKGGGHLDQFIVIREDSVAVESENHQGLVFIPVFFSRMYYEKTLITAVGRMDYMGIAN